MRALILIPIVVAALTGQPKIAQAIEVGDAIALSTNGVGSTVISVSRTGKSYNIVARTMRSNASEYCQRYEDLRTTDPKFDKCVRDNLNDTALVLKVKCRRPTIIVEGDGAYRPAAGGGPWVSVADPNSIVQADSLFRQVCRADAL